MIKSNLMDTTLTNNEEQENGKMQKKSKIYNRMLPNTKKFNKKTLSLPQKAMWVIWSACVVSYVPTLVTDVYNYVNRSDSTQIRHPETEDLFPIENVEDGGDEIKEEEIKENNNYSYGWLKNYIRPQIEEKLGFEIEGDFDILAVRELNLFSDAFSSKNTRLCILIKPENGRVFCVSYNNQYSETQIAQEGSQSDAVSSLIVHLQSSSVESIEILPEVYEDMIQNLSEQNIVFVGSAREYIEKNSEKSYLIPVFVKNGDVIEMKTFKALKNDVDQQELSPEDALMSTLYGDEDALMQEFVNNKTKDLTYVNCVLDQIVNDKVEERQDTDLFPEDIYSSEEQTSENMFVLE